MTAASPRDAKALLRAAMRARRRGCAADSPDAQALAAGRLPDDLLGRYAVVAGYAPQGAEMDPAPVLARFEAGGARIALPVARAHGEPLEFRARGGALRPDAMGVPAPGPDAEILVPDLVIAPLLSFDRAGGRLGQGAGFYDRTLAALEARGKVFALGLAYAGQEVARVPVEEHDRPLDAILTESEYLLIRKES